MGKSKIRSVLEGIGGVYSSGVQFMALPASDGLTWEVDGGNVVAEAFAVSGTVLCRGIVLANHTEDYRGLYFAHYIENKSDGSNAQDMQVFYNGLLWTAGVPEPASGLLAVIGLIAFLRRRRRRWTGSPSCRPCSAKTGPATSKKTTGSSTGSSTSEASSRPCGWANGRRYGRSSTNRWNSMT